MHGSHVKTGVISFGFASFSQSCDYSFITSVTVLNRNPVRRKDVKPREDGGITPPNVVHEVRRHRTRECAR